MHDKEPDDRNHREEVHVACCVISAEQSCQFLKLDRNGNVLGAIGNGMGIGPGQFIEASIQGYRGKYTLPV